MDIKISVIIPVYNSEMYISATLDALLTQTFPNFELICVDDGSTDHSLEILKKYQQKDARLRIIQQKSQSTEVAENIGLDHASGKYIIFLGSNDIFYPNLLKDLYEASEKENAEISICGARTYYQQQNRYAYPAEYLNVNMLPDKSCFSAEEIARYIFQFTQPAPWNKMFLREFILKHDIHFMNFQRTNDYFFVYTALSYAKKITVVPKCLIECRKEVSNNPQAAINYSEPDFYKSLVVHFDDLNRHDVNKLFIRSFCNHALDIILFHLTNVKSKEEFELLHPVIIEAADRFGLINHQRDYYYSQNKIDILVNLIDRTPEEAWENFQEYLNRTPKLQDPAAYPEGYLETAKEFPAISVVIPVYNAEIFLEECLDSVLSQTLENIEIICVNDGSTDNSRQILDTYQKKDSRIKIIDQPNGGLSNARNTGFRKAIGKYVHFLDSDDYIHPRTYEILYQRATEKNLELLAFCGETFFDPEDSRYQKGAFTPDYIKNHDYSSLHTGTELFCSMVNHKEFKSSPTMYISKCSFLRENDLFFPEDMRLHEDEYYTVILFLKAGRAEYLNTHFYHRRVRTNSLMSASSELKSAKGYMLVLAKLCSYYVENKIYTDPKLASIYLDHCLKFYSSAWNKMRPYIDEPSYKELQDYVDSLEIAFYPMFQKNKEAMKMLSPSMNDKIKAHQIKVHKSQIRELQAQSKKTATKIQELQAQNNKKDNQIQELKDKNEKKATKIQELQAQNNKKDTQIRSLKAQKKEMKNHIKAMEAELEDSHSQLYKILRKVKHSLFH